MQAPASDALGRFQDAFARALAVPGAVPAEVVALVAQPAFAVYRNTVMKGCVDALQANYPAVARLVGEEWFRAAAAVYGRATPPPAPMMVLYGVSFPDFLERFEPAAELPYLPAVARLDRCWSEAHAAQSAPALDPAAIAGLAPDALAAMVLRPHPAARWAWFADVPVYTIWSRNRAGGPVDGELDWRPEGALLTRPREVVQWTPLDAAGCVFLDACAAGATLGAAAQAARQAQADADVAWLLSAALKAGAFEESKEPLP